MDARKRARTMLCVVPLALSELLNGRPGRSIDLLFLDTFLFYYAWSCRFTCQLSSTLLTSTWSFCTTMMGTLQRVEMPSSTPRSTPPGNSTRSGGSETLTDSDSSSERRAVEQLLGCSGPSNANSTPSCSTAQRVRVSISGSMLGMGSATGLTRVGMVVSER